MKRAQLTLTEQFYKEISEVQETDEAGWYLTVERSGDIVAVNNNEGYPVCGNCGRVRCVHNWAVWQAVRCNSITRDDFVSASILAEILPDEQGGLE